MDITLKLGKLAPKIPPHLKNLREYMTSAPTAIPSEVHYAAGVAWGMDLNDTIGDCTIAGVDHLLKAWNSEVPDIVPTPDDSQISATYFQLTGGPDSGLVESDVLNHWRTAGLFGTTIDGFAPVTNDFLHIRESIYWYGASYLGIQCPQSAQQQFAAGQVWSVVPNSPIVGGHCIVLTGYDADLFYGVSWGQQISIEPAWLTAYVDEVWAVIAPEFVTEGRGPTLDIAQLQSDLNVV